MLVSRYSSSVAYCLLVPCDTVPTYLASAAPQEVASIVRSTFTGFGGVLTARSAATSSVDENEQSWLATHAKIAVIL